MSYCARLCSVHLDVYMGHIARLTETAPAGVWAEIFRFAAPRAWLPYLASIRAARSAAKGSEKRWPSMALKRGAAEKKLKLLRTTIPAVRPETSMTNASGMKVSFCWPK